MDITVTYYYSDGSEECATFDLCGLTIAEVEEKGEEYCPEDEILSDYTIDKDFEGGPDDGDFDDLVAYAENVEEFGEAYALRWEDIGDFNFSDHYEGCWNNEEDFARNLIEQCYNIPDFIYNYIDWESWARDLMMDYSAYEGDEGVHIFRD